MAWWDRVDWSDPIERDCPLNLGLVGWWMGAPNCCGGTRLQDLPNRSHGTLTNMDPATDWVATQYGSALDFDGTNDVVSVPDAENLRITGRLTLVASVNAATQSAINKAILGKYDTATSNRGYVLQAGDTAGAGTTAVKFVYQSNGASFNAAQAVQTATGVLNSQWRMVGATYIPSTWAGIYVDGALSASTTTSVPSAIYSSTAAVGIGGWGSAPTSAPLLGQCGFAAIFSVDKSAVEHAALYDQWRRGFPDQLRWLRGRSMVSVPAAGGATPWLYTHRQPQIIGGGLGL